MVVERFARRSAFLLLVMVSPSPSHANACTPAQGDLAQECLSGDSAVEFTQRKFKMDSQAKLHSERKRKAAPNILIFHPDDMYHALVDWSGMGVENMDLPAPPDLQPSIPLTPTSLTRNLARLVSEGTTFTHAYTVASMCSPSRAALLTGRYPSRNVYMFDNTVEDWGDGFDTYVKGGRLVGADVELNIAQYMSALGYATGHVGKWHMTPYTEDGGEYTSEYTAQRDSVKKRGFQYVEGLYATNIDHDSQANFTHNMEWITEKALEFMDKCLARDQPFFLYFNPTCPHSPDAIYALNVPGTAHGTPAGRLGHLPDFSKYCSECRMADRSTIWSASNLSQYNNSVRNVSKVSSVYWNDEALGVLYSYLSEKGALDSTYIVVTTDHGDAKYLLYERGTRVPLIVRGPDVQRGAVVHEVVANIDIVPTALEWGGAGSTPGVDTDGVSWASLASGKATGLGRSHIFLEIVFDRAVLTNQGIKVINAAQGDYANSGLGVTWESYPWFGEEYQLYDTTSDNTEQVSLVNESAALLQKGKALIAAHKALTLNNIPDIPALD